MKAHILVCFLAYVLWKTLAQWMSRCGLGDAPRTLLWALSKVRSARCGASGANPSRRPPHGAFALRDRAGRGPKAIPPPPRPDPPPPSPPPGRKPARKPSVVVKTFVENRRKSLFDGPTNREHRNLG